MVKVRGFNHRCGEYLSYLAVLSTSAKENIKPLVLISEPLSNVVKEIFFVVIASLSSNKLVDSKKSLCTESFLSLTTGHKNSLNGYIKVVF